MFKRSVFQTKEISSSLFAHTTSVTRADNVVAMTVSAYNKINNEIKR